MIERRGDTSSMGMRPILANKRAFAASVFMPAGGIWSFMTIRAKAVAVCPDLSLTSKKWARYSRFHLR
jgi:hypothetical protein